MKAFRIIPALAALLVSPSWALSERACATLWMKADADDDGVVLGAEAGRYLAAIRMDGRLEPRDGRIRRPLFMNQCRVGVYSTDSHDRHKPTSAHWAKDRAVAAGYPDVEKLSRDSDGVWHGTISNDRPLNVTVHPDGRVVAKPSASTGSDNERLPRPWGQG